MNHDICSAIRGRRVLRLDYKGGAREVEPHLHGSTANGDELLLAYQIGGYSESGASHGWKMLHIADTSGLVITVRRFSGARDDYKPEHPAFAVVHCRL